MPTPLQRMLQQGHENPYNIGPMGGPNAGRGSIADSLSSGITGMTNMGQANSGGTVGGLVGNLGGMALGIPGLGLLGSAIGTGMDVSSMSDDMKGMNENPDDINFGPAFGYNLSFGRHGRGVDEQAIDSIQSNADTVDQAIAEAAAGSGSFGGGAPSEAEAAAQAAMSDNAGVAEAQAAVAAVGGEGGPGGEGTVICTALYHHGLMPKRIYVADQHYGITLWKYDPEVMVGYHAWAKPIAQFITKHKWAAKIIKPLVMPWANEIGGDSSRIGRAYIRWGVPMCRLIGRLKKTTFVVRM